MDYTLLKPTKIVYSRRRSIALIVNSRGELIVRAPLRCRDKDIYDFIFKKADWIREKRTEIKSGPYTPLTPKTGEKIPILDNIYEIKLGQISRVKIINNNICIPGENSKQKLVNFLVRYAKNYLTKRVGELATIFNFKYKSIRLTSAHTRWGSCNYQNSLSFTYKLILCPRKVVDYIIIHELSHTIEKNHSKKFWALVEKCMPDYKDSERWLKDNRAIIYFI